MQRELTDCGISPLVRAHPGSSFTASTINRRGWHSRVHDFEVTGQGTIRPPPGRSARWRAPPRDDQRGDPAEEGAEGLEHLLAGVGAGAERALRWQAQGTSFGLSIRRYLRELARDGA